MDPGDTVSNTLKKEFGEEALNSLEMPELESSNIKTQLENLFKHGQVVCIFILLCIYFRK